MSDEPEKIVFNREITEVEKDLRVIPTGESVSMLAEVITFGLMGKLDVPVSELKTEDTILFASFGFKGVALHRLVSVDGLITDDFNKMFVALQQSLNDSEKVRLASLLIGSVTPQNIN